MDPLLDLILLLRPRAALFGGGLDASGSWSLGFRKRDDLLFCWIEQGECLLLRPQQEPLLVRQGDFVLIRTGMPFALASDPLVEPIDSEDAVASAKNVRLTLGAGSEKPVTLHAGKFMFDTANEDLLSSLLPPLVHIPANDTALGRVHTLMEINEAEARQPGPASQFIIVRIVELILVEILRNNSWQMEQSQPGLLSGLADPVIARALKAIHHDLTHNWSLDELAKLCGVSRTIFSSKFRRIVGVPAIEYLIQWRMTRAKEELRRGTKSISEIAFAVGFKSASAFTTSFTRVVGISPKQFAHRNPRHLD